MAIEDIPAGEEKTIPADTENPQRVRILAKLKTGP